MAAVEARSITVELDIERHGWWSNESVDADLTVTNAPAGDDLQLTLTMFDTNGVVMEEAQPLPVTASRLNVPLEMSSFYRGDTFHRLLVHIHAEARGDVADIVHSCREYRGAPRLQ